MKPELYDTSKYAGKTQSDAPAPYKVAYFEHDFGSYQLEARVTFNEAGDWPHTMSIHGALSDYTKEDAVTFGLVRQGISVLSITISGHSELSPLKNSETSMVANIREAETFFKYLPHAEKKTIIAYSLGGTPAIKLLDLYDDEIDKFVLFYPAIYATEAYYKPYGPEFTKILHRPYSYRQNDTIALLEDFQGKVLLIKGEYDGLDPVDYGKPAGTAAGRVMIGDRKVYSPIPRDVYELIVAAVPEADLRFVEIAGMDHSIAPWLGAHPEETAQLVGQVASFIKG